RNPFAVTQRPEPVATIPHAVDAIHNVNFGISALWLNPLMSAGLSQAGYIKAMKVLTMEDVVRIMENDTTGHRDAERYHFAIFGKPAATGTWGWRIEGHHLSLNFVIRNGARDFINAYVLWRKPA